MILIILRYLLLIGLGLLTGLEFCSTYCVHPAFLNLEPTAYIPVRQALDKTFTPIVASLIFTSGILLFANLFTVKKKMSLEFFLYLTAFILFQIGIIITIKGTVPINIAIDKMNPMFPPIDLNEMREKWNVLNTYRTWSSLAGFSLYSAAIFTKITR